jgi:hypothetical protein
MRIGTKKRTANEPLPSFIWPRNSPYADNVATLLPDPLRSSAGDGAFLYRWALKKMTCPIDAIAAADPSGPALVRDVRDPWHVGIAQDSLRRNHVNPYEPQIRIGRSANG